MDRRSATDVILQFLLSSGADINATDKFGSSSQLRKDSNRERESVCVCACESVSVRVSVRV